MASTTALASNMHIMEVTRIFKTDRDHLSYFIEENKKGLYK